jgi:hypothetical protein
MLRFARVGSHGLWLCLCFAHVSSSAHLQTPASTYQQTIQINHNLDKDVITARLVRFRVANDVDRYHTVDLSAEFVHSFKTKETRPKVDLEVFTVVKARRLNTDLYVVFVADDKEMHFGSNRSAIRNPVPGRLWMGERMVFSVPLEEFQKLAATEKLAIKMGGIRLDLNDDARLSLKLFAEKIAQITH